jgi:general stress protein 26
MKSDHEKLGELIKDIRIAMLTTVEPDGTLHTRPLATLRYANDGELWFFTALDSAKVHEIEEDRRASVTYSDTEDNVYVAVSGTADIVQDRRKAEELWTPMAKAWFPKGLDDPELALLRVRIERGEYWDSPGRAAYLFGVAKASMTGQPTNMGENRKLTM